MTDVFALLRSSMNGNDCFDRCGISLPKSSKKQDLTLKGGTILECVVYFFMQINTISYLSDSHGRPKLDA